MDNDLKLDNKVLVKLLLKSLPDKFDTTRDMILVLSHKNKLGIDEIVSILATQDTKLNYPISERDNSSHVVNFAGHGKNNKHNKSRIGRNKKHLYCGYHGTQVGHIQNDCPDILRTEPGKILCLWISARKSLEPCANYTLNVYKKNCKLWNNME